MNPNFLGALERYTKHRIRTGSFLEAVLSNDLFDACARADQETARDLHEIVKYIFNTLPMDCYGSREKVDAWLRNDPDEEGRTATPDATAELVAKLRDQVFHIWSNAPVLLAEEDEVDLILEALDDSLDGDIDGDKLREAVSILVDEFS